jgi:hypothetical protein
LLGSQELLVEKLIQIYRIQYLNSTCFKGSVWIMENPLNPIYGLVGAQLSGIEIHGKL